MTDQPLGRSRIVRGEVLVPSDRAPDDAAELIVVVEDVSRADAPSAVLGEFRLAHPHLEPGVAVPFEVEVEEEGIDPRGSYSIRAYVDVSGSGEVEPGDLLSTQSYPVLSPGSPEETTVELKQI